MGTRTFHIPRKIIIVASQAHKKLKTLKSFINKYYNAFECRWKICYSAEIASFPSRLDDYLSGLANQGAGKHSNRFTVTLSDKQRTFSK